jgi:hypothetical protein
MKIMIETTKWEGSESPNHIYIFDNFVGSERTAKVIAYSAFGNGPVKKFKKPLVIDLKGRTFAKVD